MKFIFRTGLCVGGGGWGRGRGYKASCLMLLLYFRLTASTATNGWCFLEFMSKNCVMNRIVSSVP